MKFIPLLLILLLVGCSWLVPSPKKPKSAKDSQYKLQYKGSDWSAIKQDQSDYVFQHQNGTTIIINSFCGEFQNDPLKQMAEKTFNGLDNIKNIQEKSMTVSNREAYSMQADGGLDGVTVNIKIINMRRNNCYFDFVRITPSGIKLIDNQPEDFINQVEFLL